MTHIRSSASAIARAGLLLAIVASGCAGGSGGPPPKLYAEAVPSIEAEITRALASRGDCRLAILPLEADGDIARSVGGLLLDDLSAALAKNPAITFIERDKLKAILGEISLQQSGLLEQEHEIQTGKMAGAEVLLAVRVTLVGEAAHVAVRLMDVAKATALTGVTVRIPYDDDLKAAIEDRNALLNIRTSKEVLAALGQIRAGELSDAEEYFEPLSKEEGERRSVGLMGLAGVAYARGQLGPAKEMCEVSRKLSDAPSYCWVIEGHVAYGLGDLGKASDLYTRASIDEGTLLDWQRSAAANGLGLIAMSRDELDNALAQYDRAITLDANNTEAISNKARILEQQGDLATAIALYQRGLKADPDDKVLMLLLRDAQMRATMAQDTARQQTIAALASEIIAKKDKDKATPKRRDPWTSIPMSFTLLPWQEKGAPPSRLGETSFLEGSVRAALEDLKGVDLVDRQLLNKVLEELQISSSALGDQTTALQVGKIVSAQILLGGTVVRMDGESQITLKLIETQSTRILATVSEIFDGGERASKVAGRMRELLEEKVRQVFPLRGRVVAQKKDRVKLNVGSRLGAEAGERYKFYADSGGDPLGEGTTIDVEKDHIWVQLQDPARIPKGARAERKL